MECNGVFKKDGLIPGGAVYSESCLGSIKVTIKDALVGPKVELQKGLSQLYDIDGGSMKFQAKGNS